jgi:hypothetical protein
MSRIDNACGKTITWVRRPDDQSAGADQGCFWNWTTSILRCSISIHPSKFQAPDPFVPGCAPGVRACPFWGTRGGKSLDAGYPAAALPRLVSRVRQFALILALHGIFHGGRGCLGGYPG